MGNRANALADRIELGAQTLAGFAEGLSDAEWRAPVPPDGRPVGVIIHHVATMYPTEVELAQTIGSGKAIAGLTWEAIAQLNAKHAHGHAAVGKAETLKLLRENARAAAGAVRALTDEQLDRAAPVSLAADAPMTAQFFIEDHALRHSFHHLARIRAALQR
jgi:hypothetical protein